MAVIEDWEDVGAPAPDGEAREGSPAVDEEGFGDLEPEYDPLKAQDAKALGNTHYSAGEWQLACDAYTEAIMWAPPDVEVRRGATMRARVCALRSSPGLSAHSPNRALDRAPAPARRRGPSTTATVRRATSSWSSGRLPWTTAPPRSRPSRAT